MSSALQCQASSKWLKDLFWSAMSESMVFLLASPIRIGSSCQYAFCDLQAQVTRYNDYGKTLLSGYGHMKVWLWDLVLQIITSHTRWHIRIFGRELHSPKVKASDGYEATSYMSTRFMDRRITQASKITHSAIILYMYSRVNRLSGTYKWSLFILGFNAGTADVTDWNNQSIESVRRITFQSEMEIYFHVGGYTAGKQEGSCPCLGHAPFACSPKNWSAHKSPWTKQLTKLFCMPDLELWNLEGPQAWWYVHG